MKTRVILLWAFAAVFSAGHLQAQSIRVGIIGDQTSSEDLVASYESLKRGVEILREQNVSVLLHTGDLIESRRTETEVRADFQRAMAILDSLGNPWHVTPGDHDVNPSPFKQNSPDRTRENLYRDLYRTREPGLTDSLDHSFNSGSYHFISLNSQRQLHSDPRWGTVFLAKITDDQVRWLVRDLENNRKARGIVVFLHQPLWYNWADWSRVHEVLRNYPVAAVVAGHFHYSQDEGTIDGIRYVVAGAAGGMTKSSNPRGGTAAQVMVLTLNGRSAAFQALAIADGAAIPLPPRKVMDRLHALDVASGQSDLGARSSVCVSSSGLSGRLNISAVGNPIDTPVRVRIEPAGREFVFKDSQFAAGACQSVQNGECILGPADRVASANNSSVQLNTRAGPLPNLWSAEVLSNGSAPKAGSFISVKLRMSFDSSIGELFVDHIAAAVITDCSQTPSINPVADTYLHQVYLVEDNLLRLAEAMPADKYDFRPAGGAFTDVRTFGEQVRHSATMIYMTAAIVLGEESPYGPGTNNNGPDSIQGKERIVEYVKASLAYARKAMASLNEKNHLDMVKTYFGLQTRIAVASGIAYHSYDHYGQMVVYARMNGIIPPASQPREAR